MALVRCPVSTDSRLFNGQQSVQPRHFSHLHFFVQGASLSAHQDLQTCGDGAVVGGDGVVAEAVVIVVVAVVVPAHGGHPIQQSHEHLNDQLSELCAQKDLHSPKSGVNVLVVLVSVLVVFVSVGGGGVGGGGVGGGGVVIGASTHCE